jgi:hypothetical protein
MNVDRQRDVRVLCFDTICAGIHRGSHYFTVRVVNKAGTGLVS